MLKTMLLNFIETNLYICQKYCIRFIYSDNQSINNFIIRLKNIMVIWIIVFNLYWSLFHEPIELNIKGKEKHILFND